MFLYYPKGRHLFRLLIILFAVSLSINCRTIKPIKPSAEATQAGEQRLHFKTAKALTASLKENEFNYDWLTSKFSVNLDIDSNKQSFNVSMRAKKDSAIWMSVSLLGIEGARMLVTADSLKFIDRINNKYFVGDYNYLSQLVHIDLDFEMLQSVLIGNSVEFYDEDEKLKSAKDSTFYLLTTLRKKKLQKVINKIVINDFSFSRTFTGVYSDFQVIDSSYFPFKASFNIEAQKNIKMKINYSKVVKDKPQSMPFNIPSKYAPIR
jgi:hypothetical protein